MSMLAAEIPAAEALAAFDRDVLPLARRDYRVFVSACFRDERGGRIEVAPFQAEWVRLVQTHRNLVLWCPPEHGKSMHMSVFMPLWLLAHEPNLRVCIVSATAMQAAKFGRMIRETIERNPVYHRIFPHVRPARPWTDTMLTIQRSSIQKDPSVQAIGVEGAILGARVDLLVLDDVLTEQNTHTERRRDRVFQRIVSTFMTRMSAIGRTVAIGVPWHERDAYHRLAREAGFEVRSFPAVRDGVPLWPERWRPERLARRQAEVTPDVWRRQYLLDVHRTESPLLSAEWVAEAKERGRSIDPATYVCQDRERLVCGVDLGASASGGRSAFHVAAIGPTMRTVLAADAGHWRAPELAERLRWCAAMWPTVVFGVESNGTQALVADLLRDRLQGACVLPTSTTSRVYESGGDIQQIAAEFSRGQWRIAAADHPGVAMFLREFLDYSGGHMPDTLAACVVARSVGLRLLGTVGEYLPGAIMVAWALHRSVVRVRVDERVEIRAWTGEPVIAVYGTERTRATCGPWPAEFVVHDFRTMLTDHAARRAWREGMFELQDPRVVEAVEHPAPHALPWGPVVLSMALQAADVLRAGAIHDIETGQAAPPRPVASTPPSSSLSWETLRAIGLPSLSDFAIDDRLDGGLDHEP